MPWVKVLNFSTAELEKLSVEELRKLADQEEVDIGSGEPEGLRELLNDGLVKDVDLYQASKHYLIQRIQRAYE